MLPFDGGNCSWSRLDLVRNSKSSKLRPLVSRVLFLYPIAFIGLLGASRQGIKQASVLRLRGGQATYGKIRHASHGSQWRGCCQWQLKSAWKVSFNSLLRCARQTFVYSSPFIVCCSYSRVAPALECLGVMKYIIAGPFSVGHRQTIMIIEPTTPYTAWSWPIEPSNNMCDIWLVCAPWQTDRLTSTASEFQN